jgi:hypothetical protein
LAVEAVMAGEHKRRSDALYKVLIRLPRGRYSFLAAHELSDADVLRWFERRSEILAHASITGDTSSLDFEGMNRKGERERLCEIQKLARQLSRKVRGLHPDTRRMLRFASQDVREFISVADMEFWRRFWQTLETLDHTIDEALPEAKRWIDIAPELGKREQLIIAIVEALRDLWGYTTGAKTPKSLSATGEFANFMTGAFQALELAEDPRSAMQSWSAYDQKNRTIQS